MFYFKNSLLILLFSFLVSCIDSERNDTPKSTIDSTSVNDGLDEVNQLETAAVSETVERKKKIEKKDSCITIKVKEYRVVDSFSICSTYEEYEKWTLTLFLKNGKRQIIDLPGHMYSFQGWGIDENLCSKMMCFNHFDSDNLLDFRIKEAGGTGGTRADVYLFENTEKKFVRNEFLSNEHNLTFNRNRNVYQSSFRGDPCSYEYKRFEMKNDTMEVLKKVELECIQLENGKEVFQRLLIIKNDTFAENFKILKECEKILCGQDPVFSDFIDFREDKNNWVMLGMKEK